MGASHIPECSDTVASFLISYWNDTDPLRATVCSLIVAYHEARIVGIIPTILVHYILTTF